MADETNVFATRHDRCSCGHFREDHISDGKGGALGCGHSAPNESGVETHDCMCLAFRPMSPDASKPEDK